jgi:class 3 adenylate cyclase
MPDADTEALRWFNELQRVSTSAENAVAIVSAVLQLDVTDLLPQVKTPTLVIHRRGDAIVPFERGRELASLIPGARFLPLEGKNHTLLPGEPERVQYDEAVEEFLAEERKPAKRKPPKAAAPSGLVTIMFTDMEGSTSLTQRLGDARAQEVLRTHNTVVRDALKAHSGSETKHTGDGIMATLPAASKALEAAVAIQRGFAEHNESAEMPIRVRIGLNAGEPVAEDDPDGRRDLFGTAVQLAARICAHAEPGQILASNVVRELSAGKGVLFSDQGEVTLRGFEEPVRLYEVRWD